MVTKTRGGEPKYNGHTYGHNRHQVLKWEMVPGFWQVVDHTVCIVFLKIIYKHFALSLQTRTTLKKNAFWEYLSVAENSSVSIQPRENQWNHSTLFPSPSFLWKHTQYTNALWTINFHVFVTFSLWHTMLWNGFFNYIILLHICLLPGLTCHKMRVEITWMIEIIPSEFWLIFHYSTEKRE